MCQHLVQPLKRPVQVHFDPAGGAGDILSVILSAPALKGGEKRKKWTNEP